MNWARGLFRTWSVASLLWLAIWTVLEWRWLSCKVPAIARAGPWESYRCNPFDEFDPWEDFLLPALLPPLILLVVGGLLLWAVRGFRRSV
jgi:hypothetical protein